MSKSGIWILGFGSLVEIYYIDEASGASPLTPTSSSMPTPQRTTSRQNLRSSV